MSNKGLQHKPTRNGQSFLLSHDLGVSTETLQNHTPGKIIARSENNTIFAADFMRNAYYSNSVNKNYITDLITGVQEDQPTSRGMAVEEGATNLIINSRDYIPIGTNLTVTPNVRIGDDNSKYMDLLTVDTTAGTLISISGHIFTTTTALLSFEIAKGNFDSLAAFRFGAYDITAVGDIGYITFDFSTKLTSTVFGTVTDHDVVHLDNDIYRIWMKIPVVIGNTNTIYFGASGSVFNAGTTWFLGDSQAEDTRLTSKIITEGSSASRTIASPSVIQGSGSDLVPAFDLGPNWSDGPSTTTTLVGEEMQITGTSAITVYLKDVASLGNFIAGQEYTLSIASAEKITGNNIRASITTTDTSASDGNPGAPILDSSISVSDFSGTFVAPISGEHFINLYAQDFVGDVEIHFTGVTVEAILPYPDYDPLGGWILFEFAPTEESDNALFQFLGDGTAFFGAYIDNIVAGTITLQNHDGTNLTADIQTANTVILNNTNRLAINFATDDFRMSLNGGTVVSDTTSTLRPMMQMLLGNQSGLTRLNGNIRVIRAGTGTKTNNELQFMSTI